MKRQYFAKAIEAERTLQERGYVNDQNLRYPWRNDRLGVAAEVRYNGEGYFIVQHALTSA